MHKGVLPSTVLEARKSEVKCRTQINPWEKVLRNGVERLRINAAVGPLSRQWVLTGLP
jgi:hypothetical protein